MMIASQAGRVAVSVLVIAITAPVHLSAQSSPPLAAQTTQTVPALDRPARLSVREVQLADALVTLYEKSGVPVSFSPSLVPRRTVSCNCDTISVSRALEIILHDSGLDYREIDGHVLVYRRPQLDVIPALHVPDRLYAKPAAAGPSELITFDLIPRAGSLIGTVVEAGSLSPLVNAQIAIDGEGRAVTDVDGRYRIVSVPAGRYTVTVTSIGYRSARQDVDIAEGTTTADFELEVMPTVLQELVVTATGEQRRAELGHVVGRINADSLVREAPVSTLSELLNARVPGLQVLTTSGTVGGSVSLRLRGQTTVNLSTDPIVIVDGIRYSSGTTTKIQSPWNVEPTSRLNDINPNDIASVEVVKGPSAAALYGTDAANGVIVVTTKRGQAGETRWNAYVRSGITEIPEYRHPELYWGWGSGTSSCILRSVAQGSCAQDSVTVMPNPLNDPELTIFGAKPRYQYGGSVSGGSEALQFFLSADYEDATGPVQLPPAFVQAARDEQGRELPNAQLEPNSLEKLNLRTNVTARLRENAEIRINAGYTQSEVRQIAALGPYNMGASSARPTRDAYGSYDPLSSFARTSTERINRFLGGATAEWLPVAWLRTRATVGLDLTSGNRYSLAERNELDGFAGQIGDDRTRILVSTGEIGATASLRTGRFTSRTSVGAQYVRSVSDVLNSQGSDLRPGGASIGDANSSFTRQFYDETVTLGSYVEQVLGVNDRLFLTAAIRGDGASTFGNDYRAAYYPKAGASWMLSEEPFFPGIPRLDELRLRYAFGSSGQQPRPTMRRLTFTLSSAMVGGAMQNSLEFYRLPNPDLRPERVREHEFGFDIGAFDSRLQLGLTWNRRETVDQISSLALPTGMGSQWINIGRISGRGFEAQLNATVLDTRFARLSVHASHASNTEKLLDLGGLAASYRRNGSLVEGFPIGASFMRPLLGYDDANGDGILAVDEVIMGDSAVYMGRSTPGRTQALTPVLAFAQQRVRLSALLERRSDFVQFDRLNDRAQSVLRGAVDPTAPLEMQARIIATRTGGPPGHGFAGYSQISEGDFIRLREVSLAIDLPQAWLGFTRMDRATLSLSGRNIALWTDFTGPDPESARVFPTGGGEADFLPQARSWAIRLDMGF